MGDRPSRRLVGHLVLTLAVTVAFTATTAAASGRAPAAATTAADVATGSYAGTLDGAPVAVAVTAEAPGAEGQPRTISMYVCNGTSISAWLTGVTTGNSATLRSADGRFGAQVQVTSRRAGGTFALPGGERYRFVAPRVTLTSGLFDVTVLKNGLVRGRSLTGATVSGRVGVGASSPSNGSVVVTAGVGGVAAKLTVLAHDLTAGAYRWILLPDGKVFGANKRGPGFGGLGGIDPGLVTTGKVVRIHAGSAGVKGWSTGRCQALANKWDKLVESAGDDIAQGNDASADAKLTKAQGMLSTLESNCMVTGIG